MPEGLFKLPWESLKNYKIPDWYKDAKFGIFIHFGVYAVPAFGNERISDLLQRGIIFMLF
jgi:alpha-L-fucosidase